ncbi:MAG: class I SAM-dependent methyltransferase [Pseudomonadota bacterium]
MSGQISLTNPSLNTYDEVPYESYPYASSCPEHLRTLAMIFGANPPKLESARILELGCAAGGNIIPIALRYPKSHCVGVDLSKVQTDFAKAQVTSLGIKNMDIRCASITDVDSSYGKFDYIICHGVISWVPEAVQASIFDVCGSLLTEKGLAYISYNTLPGWNMVRSIRDMMLYHAESFSGIGEKVQQARLLLDFVKDSLEGSSTPYAEMLKKEAELLAQQPDHYLRHDHLEENNKQFYFSDFMAAASVRGLQYVGDANLPSMFLGNLPAKVSDKLKEVADIVRSEQYMDFINNRRFRSTILCRNTMQLNRSLNLESIKDFYLGMKVVPEKPIKELKLEDSLETAKFFYQGNKDNNLSSSSPFMKAILYSFAENWNMPLSIDELVKASMAKLPSASAQDIKSEIINNAMRMVLSGYITITSEKPHFTNILTAKPKVSELVRYQSEHIPGLWVTNEMHDRIGVTLLEKYAFRYMDGKHTKEDLVTKLMAHVKKNELTLSRDGVKLEDEAAIKKEMTAAVEQMLERTKTSALLVA